MIHRIPTALLLLSLLSLFSCKSTDHVAKSPPGTLDPRLGGFLEQVFKDNPSQLEKEKHDYASLGVTFEPFIYSVYTGVVKFDTTPDNSMAMAQLGEYLEKARPELAPGLLEQMESFYRVEANQTTMRGMFLTTVRGLTKGR
jgi:hypothetical protein